MRSLAVVLNRTAVNDNTGLKDLIKAYTDTQFNALLDFARQGGGNDYSPFWHGPFEQFYTHGQMDAVEVLVAAVRANQ